MKNKQKLAENEHKKFVDLMHPHFGLENKPDYCKVYFRPLLAMGNLQEDPWRIAISDNYNLESDRDKIVHTVRHESSHYLHYLKNPSIKLMEISKDLSEEEHEYDGIIYLREGIADLGALLMLKMEGNLDYNQVRKYHLKIPDGRLEEEQMLTWVIAMKDSKFLEELAKNGVPEARKLMNQHREEALIYVNSICRKELKVLDDFL